MSRDNSYNIGLFIDTSRIIGRGVLRGFAKYSKLHGSWMLNPTYVNNKPKLTLNALKKAQYDALVIVEQNVSEEILDFIRTNKIPSVIKCDFGKVAGMCNIISDNLTIGKKAADYFIKKGFKNFAYCGFSDINWSATRKDKFINTICEAGFDSKDVYCKEFSPKLTPAVLTKIENWLKELPTPIALLANNDELAKKIIDICNLTQKIKVPFDISVLGIDNDDLVCDISNPPISSISRNFELVGFTSAEWIDDVISQKSFQTKDIILEPMEIVTRQSTDVYATEDNSVKTALEYIRKNASKNITVDDVAMEVAISRRSLERKFIQSLHTTISKEIRRIRTNLIAQLLTDTDFPVSEIAEIMDFKSAKHIARYFAYTKHTSPLAYRKKTLQ